MRLHPPVLHDKVIEAADLLIRIVLVCPSFRGQKGNIAFLSKGSWKDHKINFGRIIFCWQLYQYSMEKWEL